MDQISKLSAAFQKGVSSVPLLTRAFQHVSAPTTIQEWSMLPVTTPGHYSSVSSVREASAGWRSLFSPVAPRLASSPCFPMAALHSYRDRELADDRVLHILNVLGMRTPMHIVLVYDDESRYYTSDLADLLCTMEFDCFLVASGGNSLAITMELKPDLTFWLCCDPCPWLARSVVISTGPGLCSEVPAGHNGYVIDHDLIPYLAVTTNGSRYSTASGQFFFEKSDFGTLLVTTLRQELMPLIRFDTGITILEAQPESFIVSEPQ